MKKINEYRNLVPLIIATLMLTYMQYGCKKAATTPEITTVRNYAAAPGDSTLTNSSPGQWVVIQGKNLKGALSIEFNGVPASFNEALFSEENAVVLMPAVIPFPSVPAAQLNTIHYVTTHGETTFSFNVSPPAPTITSISNENANAGDSVMIYGLNFFFMKSLVFAGIPVTNYTPNANGTVIGLRVPSNLSQSGIVSVTTQSGKASTFFNVNDVKTRVICNFDDINNYSFGATAITSDASLFPGNRLKYARLNFTNIPVNDFGWYNGGRSVNLNSAQWIPVAELTNPIASYALKFEIYVKQPWTTGTILIRNESTWKYIARYAPWKVDANTSISYTTAGWTTVTIPLTLFKTKANGIDGSGTSAPSLIDLLGPTGQKEIGFMFVNDSNTPVTSFDGAIDNVRIMKIQ